jgi:serine/threonine protein kinase
LLTVFAQDLIRILQDPFPEAAVQSITRDCTLGLSFLHRQKVVHRDLKVKEQWFCFAILNSPRLRPGTCS